MQNNSPTVPGRRGRRVVLVALRVGTAALLVVDGVVHLSDAVFYGPVDGVLVSEGALFQVQGVLALVLAGLLLVWPHNLIWGAAAVVAASAVGAVVLYTYVDVGPVLGLPDLYEPSWGLPGKLESAVAEGAAVVLAIIGLLLSRTPRTARADTGSVSAGSPGGVHR